MAALAGRRRAVTGRARTRRSGTGAPGTPRAPCTQARVSSRAPLVPRLGAAERPSQLLHQPAVELVGVACARGRASRALAGAVGVGAQRGARGRRAAVRQRAHGGRRAVRAQRGGAARRQRRSLRPRLRHFPHAPAARLLLVLGRAPRPLRVVYVPIVLHNRHHERHLGGDDDSSVLTFLLKFCSLCDEKLS